MQSPDAPGAAARVFVSSEQACDRQQILGRDLLESDPEARVVVSPPGRTEESRVKGRLRPGDATSTVKAPTRRKSKLDLDRRAGRDAGGGRRSEAAESNVETSRGARQSAPLAVADAELRVESDAFAAPGRSSIVCDSGGHGGLLWLVSIASAKAGASLERKMRAASLASLRRASGIGIPA
jgi:hypothetical protein